MTADSGNPMSPHLRGHLLQFDRTPWPAHSSSAGARLLLLSVALEATRLAAVTWLDALPLWGMLPALLGLGLLALPRVTGVPMSQTGFRAWREWSATEKSYFCQLVVIANVVFPVVFAASIKSRFARPDLAWSLWTVFVPYLCFGFYQELVYRGMIQRELVRRWGPLAGVVTANLLYTFGPLHSYYLASRTSLAVPMFASIFAIGLFFGAVYQRSGNLWIVGVAHALGNAYILWSMGPVR